MADVHGNDLKGIVLTLALVGLCWAVTLFIKNKKLFGPMSAEVGRKILHIGVSNFAFIYLYVFESWYIPFAGLLGFAVMNVFVELRTDMGRGWGMVEYPLVSALMILLVHLGVGTPRAFAAALLGMGYGDGLAPLAGRAVKSPVIPGTKGKTLSGSAVLFAAVFIVCLAVTGLSAGACLLTALLAAAAEAWTPFGLDNVSLPLVVFTMTGIVYV